MSCCQCQIHALQRDPVRGDVAFDVEGRRRVRPPVAATDHSSGTNASPLFAFIGITS